MGGDRDDPYIICKYAMGAAEYAAAGNGSRYGRLSRLLETPEFDERLPFPCCACRVIVVAFMLLGEKHLLILIAGAAVSALIGALLIQWVTAASRIKEDTAMGIVLSVFFGLGTMLLTIVNRTSTGNQSGLDNFIFGQAATMIRSDVYMMSMLAMIVILVVIVLFKEWKLFLFDPSFGKGLGMSLKAMNIIYTFVLVLTIVMGIQAVGVILMAALLIIPAVSARYWTDSFFWMIFLSAVFGGGCGALGTIISALGAGWPTGPFMCRRSGVLHLFTRVWLAKRMVDSTAGTSRKRKQVTYAHLSTYRPSVERGGVKDDLHGMDYCNGIYSSDKLRRDRSVSYFAQDGDDGRCDQSYGAAWNRDRVFVTRSLSGIHMLIGAIVAGLLTAILVQWLHHRGVQQDASIGVVFTILFAIGVILIATRSATFTWMCSML